MYGSISFGEDSNSNTLSLFSYQGNGARNGDLQGSPPLPPIPYLRVGIPNKRFFSGVQTTVKTSAEFI